MPSAREVADLLAATFLREGYYSAAPGAMRFQASASAAIVDYDQFAAGTTFGGLEVQSVAHEVGVDDPRVFVYLTRGSAKLIRSLPQEVAGISVVARRMGNIVVRPDAAVGSTNRGNYYERNGRVCCGSSCAPTSENSSGTLGAIMKTSGANPRAFLLSNNHVLAGCNHVARDQPILSPSNNDGRAGITAPREIGRLERIEELRSGVPEFVTPCNADVALARVTDPSLITSWQGDTINGFDTPSRTISPQSYMRVKKFGRTTGFTTGEIEAEVSVALPVTYNAKLFKGTVWFEKVWSVRPAHDVFVV